MCKHNGLYPKYAIEKINGKPCDPNAQYFVLRVDTDPHARRALAEYAESVREVSPKLAEDIEEMLGAYDIL